MIRLAGIHAVFFDLDDTLCGYWDASKKALSETFRQHAPEGLSSQQLLDAWADTFREFSPVVKNTDWYDAYLKEGGVTRTEQMRLTLERLGVIDSVLAQQLSLSYAEKRDHNLTLFSDALDVLQQLASQYPLGLITNGPADIQRQEIETLKINDYFKFILIEGEMGEGKPLMSVFRRAESLAGAAPEANVFIGNSYAHDVRPAIEAGWRSIWIRRPSDVAPSRMGMEAKPEQKPENSPDPDAIIYELNELLPMLLPRI